MPAANAQGKFKDGLFITVENPITDSTTETIKYKIEDAKERQGREIEAVIFDFTSQGVAGTSKSGPCIELKNLIQKLNQQNINTTAFVDGRVTKHTVLPVLACSQLIMSNDASLGYIREGNVELTAEVLAGYKDIINKRPGQGALIRKMLDGDLTISKVETAQSVEYVTARELDVKKAKGEIRKVLENRILDPGRALFKADEARKYGLCQAIFESRKAIQQNMNLPPQSLQEEWLVSGTPVPWVVKLTGTVNSGKLSSLRRRIGNAIRQGSNLVILHLDCEGGDTSGAAQFVDYLREKRKANIKFIAYVPENRHLGAATFLALGCSEIAMASNSSLGDFAYLADQSEDDREYVRKTLVKLAKDRYPEELFKATLKRNLGLSVVVLKDNPEVKQLVTLKEYDEDQNSPNPRYSKVADLLPNNDGFLKIDAGTAKDWGIVYYNDLNSLEEVYDRYNLDPSRVNVSGDDWLDRIAGFFRKPIVNIILLLIGITCLILEVKLPGFGLPGILAGICFVLFFWAHSFTGQFTMLAVLLFVLGLGLLGLEIFVIPGFGVTGIFGVLLLITSLVLVTVERMPETSSDWADLIWTVGTFGLTLLGAFGMAIAIASFLPQIPYANRLMLVPPGEDGDSATNLENATPVYAALLGAIGITETPLRPAGKARFGDDYLDVVSEGEYITPGNRVQVIEVEGNRIVVKQVF